MNKALLHTCVVVVIGSAAVALGGSAHAAAPKGGPSDNASCVGQIFAPQATDEPGAVAARIAEIKEFILPELGINFGKPISGLAKDCATD